MMGADVLSIMFRASVLVLAGGLAAQHSRVPLSPEQSLLLFAVLACLLLIRRVRGVGFVLLGFALFMQAGTVIVDARLAPKFAGDSMLTRVRIVDFPRFSGVSVTMIVTPIDDARMPARSRVSWYEPPKMPVIGDVWELELRLRRPRGYSNPGAFDLEAWMFREKIHAAGYVVNGKRNRLLESGVLSGRDEFRLDFVSRAQNASRNRDAAAVLAAIGVGARHLLTRDQWKRYAATGTSHLMAISGLHIGLAAAAAFAFTAFLSGGLRLPGNHLDHAIVGGVVLAVMYAFVSGFGVPARRATIMLCIAALAFLCRRRADPVRIVAQAALGVFLFDPVAIMAPGFNLSFAAVIVLLWLARRYWRPLAGQRCFAKLVGVGRQLCVMQGMLLLGLMPLTIMNFQRIAFLAPVVNLLTVPIFSLITVPTVLASILSRDILTTASAAMLRFSALSVSGIEAIIRAFAALPMADVTIAEISATGWCVVFLPALWVVLPRGWPGRWVAVLAVFAIVLHRPATPMRSCFDAHILDVGQGLAVVVQTAGHTLVFDTGASYRGGGSVAEQVVLPFLRHKGIDTIDWLVVSHADNDHAGGVSALASQLRIGRTFAGEPIPGTELEITDCAAGQSWRADAVEFRFLHPPPDVRGRGNNASCVLAVIAGEHRLLLTGDIEARAERRLLVDGRLQPADVVLIPHHGSLTSSTGAFVDRLRPGLAIAAAGYGNRWGFPKERVTKRWEDAGAQVLNTATSGAISVRVCAAQGVSQLREQRRRAYRFWRDPADL